jgi:hypothetical protein
MTHADLLVRLIAQTGNVSTEEASFIFESFRASFPPPEFIDKELTEEEADAMYNYYRANRELMALISQCLIEFHDGLPSA